MNKKTRKQSMLMYVLMALMAIQSKDILVNGDEYESEAYSNQIVGIQEIYGAKNFTIVLTFEQDGPIITYAPASYADSQNDSFNRFFMPNTVLSDGAGSGALQQSGSGVELVLFGTLVKKIVDGNTIMISITVA
ncbi:MAG: hypothetical protein NTZ68_02345 [Candidatus Dependentiae bacterium]|nr:hypothetical protein [Candidatus Dependentiae bacterium]